MKIKLLLLLAAFAGSISLVNAQAADEGNCSQQHTGSYSFYNTSKNLLQLKVTYCYMPVGAQYPAFKTTSMEFTLKPGESKNINGVMSSPGVRNNFVAKNETGTEIIDHGDFVIEECKTKTYKIK